MFADGLKNHRRFSIPITPASVHASGNEASEAPTANLDGTAPRIGTGTHALGHGLLTEFLDELLLELVPHDRHVDNHGEQVDIHDQHERQRQCRPLVGDDHGSDQDYERDRDEELAQIEAGIDVVTDVDAPRQTFRLRHVVDVATLHGIVFGVLTFADAGLGRLTAGVAILGDQRTEILRLGRPCASGSDGPCRRSAVQPCS